MSSTATESDLTSYTVAVAATTLVTGRANPQTGKPEVIRLVRGDKINAPEDSEQIQTLLSMRAIVPSDKFEGKDTLLTAHRVFRLYQRANEAQGVVQPQVAPIDAPANHPDIVRPS